MDLLEAYDLGTLYWFGKWHRPWLDALAVAVTYQGNRLVLIGVVAAAVAGLLAAGRRRQAWALLACALLGWGLEWGTKLLVGRPRPHVVWRVIDLPRSPSFPSGHALGSMAVYGGLALVLSRSARGWRKALMIATGVGLSLLIGLTRIYLGVHYPTDVVAGWCAGLACALLAYVLARPPGEG
jgi:undecaprenyl-diphosphatase